MRLSEVRALFRVTAFAARANGFAHYIIYYAARDNKCFQSLRSLFGQLDVVRMLFANADASGPNGD